MCRAGARQCAELCDAPEFLPRIPGPRARAGARCSHLPQGLSDGYASSAQLPRSGATPFASKARRRLPSASLAAGLAVAALLNAAA
eukprot:8217293-Pyramimonas_sp.AAC.1